MEISYVNHKEITNSETILLLRLSKLQYVVPTDSFCLCEIHLLIRKVTHKLVTMIITYRVAVGIQSALLIVFGVYLLHGSGQPGVIGSKVRVKL